MGKYMKKAKPKGELALVESTTSNTTTSYMGVRTRAKTLALQKSHAQQHELAATSDSYLQLRRNAEPQEASFGENVLDFEGRERSTRESTPCSLIRDSDTVRTPGSTTRPTCSAEAYRRTEHAARRQIPTSREMDEFFAEIEEAQQKKFIEKYNFDPVNEKPLSGRYEWEKLKP
ncbi:Cyclin-dependent kinase inhibitor 3 [Glycine soja]|nr:Cyclin-dependent kinase inhibitor 3 [Glycine soja]